MYYAITNPKRLCAYTSITQSKLFGKKHYPRRGMIFHNDKSSILAGSYNNFKSVHTWQYNLEIKETLAELKGEIGKLTKILREFNMTFSIVDRTSRTTTTTKSVKDQKKTWKHKLIYLYKTSTLVAAMTCFPSV